MAINNRFVYFEKQSDFDRQKSNISDYSIVFIKDSATIYTHGVYYRAIDTEVLTEEDYERLIAEGGDGVDENKFYFTYEE